MLAARLKFIIKNAMLQDFRTQICKTAFNIRLEMFLMPIRSLKMSQTNVSVGFVGMTLAALFLSGIASVVNQVVWQRGLKIFLGGSETFCSVVVVLVFMLGLGVGAIVMGMRSGRGSHPIRTFAIIELLLFMVNMAIAWLLSLDLSQTVYNVERVALSFGVPLRVIYACGSLFVLLPPTFLMGATLPLASEVCQRQLGATRSSLIAVLFFLNTLGAVAGAFASSFYLLPYFGQQISLFAAAGCNLVAAGILWGLAVYVPPVGVRGVEREAPGYGGFEPLRLEEILGTWLGFLSLGYEMYLFRLMALAHQPLPYTFATTLCFFLLFWSVGVYMAARIRIELGAVFIVAGLLVAVMPLVYAYDRWYAHFGMFGGRLMYFLPCMSFGFLYGNLVTRSAHRWGADVARFYALNTLGSCLGIIAFTFVGYEIRHDYNAVMIAIGLAVLFVHLFVRERFGVRVTRVLRVGQITLLLVGAAILWVGLSGRPEVTRGMITFWGRDGVVEVHRDGAVHIDGIWHSRLSDGSSHVGRPYSWMMAFAAVFAHRDEPISESLVVGNGIGITASTLAKLDGMHVDAYEINHTLRHVLREFPKQTLNVLQNPDIDIRWQDARSGLALDLKRYDLIISAPLYLRQAGSSILLSREYMQLAKRRLRENGVFALYAHEGEAAQALLVRRTVASVFDHSETFLNGLLIVASDTPITITAQLIKARLGRSDEFYQEVASFGAAMQHRGTSLYHAFDSPRLSFEQGKYTITDDHPLVEYPRVAEKLVQLSLGNGKLQAISDPKR